MRLPVYDWATDPGALAPGTDLDDALAALDVWIRAVDRMLMFIESRGLADDYRAWLAAR